MKKTVSIITAALLTLGLAGCNSSTVNDHSNSTVVGQVTVVDGSCVTLLLGELSEAPSGDSGQTPPSGAPQGNSTGGAQAPSGEMPSGGGFGQRFTAGEESLTITVSDAVSVTIENRDGSTEALLSDIAVGSIIEVSFGDNGTVTAVILKSVAGETAQGDAPGVQEQPAPTSGNASAAQATT